jgi:hypothetical protein
MRVLVVHDDGQLRRIERAIAAIEARLPLEQNRVSSLLAARRAAADCECADVWFQHCEKLPVPRSYRCVRSWSLRHRQNLPSEPLNMSKAMQEPGGHAAMPGEGKPGEAGADE